MTFFMRLAHFLVSVEIFHTGLRTRLLISHKKWPLSQQPLKGVNNEHANFPMIRKTLAVPQAPFQLPPIILRVFRLNYLLTKPLSLRIGAQ